MPPDDTLDSMDRDAVIETLRDACHQGDRLEAEVQTLREDL